MECGVGGAAGGGDAGDGVVEGVAGHKVARLHAVAQQADGHATRLAGGLGLGGADGGGFAEARGAYAQELERHRHRIGGELTAARARAGAGGVLEAVERVVVDAPGGVRADGLVDLLERDLLAVEDARGDGAGVEGEARDIEARQRHRACGDGLVAGYEDDEAVERVAARGDLDGVDDDLAADERAFHPLGAHRDAVGDGDGVDLHRRAARLADALLDESGHVAVVVVAGHRLRPHAGDADDGLGEVGVGEADGLEHGAGARAGGAVGHLGAAGLHRVGGHSRSSA